jgi:hypothetical protein
MKNWKVTWYEHGLKTKTIKLANIYNLAVELSARGIPEWCVVKLEQVPEEVV